MRPGWSSTIMNGSSFEDKTGLNTTSVLDRVDALIVTRGASGSMIHTRAGRIEIPAREGRTHDRSDRLRDAYRAWPAARPDACMDWETTGRIASLMGRARLKYAGHKTTVLTSRNSLICSNTSLAIPYSDTQDIQDVHRNRICLFYRFRECAHHARIRLAGWRPHSRVK